MSGIKGSCRNEHTVLLHSANMGLSAQCAKASEGLFIPELRQMVVCSLGVLYLTFGVFLRKEEVFPLSLAVEAAPLQRELSLQEYLFLPQLVLLRVSVHRVVHHLLLQKKRTE